MTGGTLASNTLTIRSTSNGTKGSILFDETTASTSSSTGSILVSGSIGISNTTDATSSTNGGTFTSAGGAAFAKKVFIGTDLTVNNYTELKIITAPGSANSGYLRAYIDTSDNLLKSKNSSGTVTVYQPITTKGDLVSHNGTTQTRLPIGTNGYILYADSTQSLGMKWINPTTVPPNPLSTAYIRDEKASGTNGGANTVNVWTTRTLNTTSYYPNSQTDISLSENNIIIQPGVYTINANTQGHDVKGHQARLYDVSTSSVICYGSIMTVDAPTTENCSNIFWILEIASQKTIRIEQIFQDSKPDGLGLAGGFGNVEVYTQVFIKRIF